MMEVGPYRRTKPGELAYFVRLRPDEQIWNVVANGEIFDIVDVVVNGEILDTQALLDLAQAEAEALADAELPPDPGEWFTYLNDE